MSFRWNTLPPSSGLNIKPMCLQTSTGFFLRHSSISKMEALCCSETSVFTQLHGVRSQKTVFNQSSLKEHQTQNCSVRVQWWLYVLSYYSYVLRSMGSFVCLCERRRREMRGIALKWQTSIMHNSSEIKFSEEIIRLQTSDYRKKWLAVSKKR
jgi:hypothetical protein